MAKGYKERIIDVTLKEFLSDVGIKSKSTFDKQFERFLEIYPINEKDFNYFKKDPQNEATEFEFKWEWYHLFKFLFTTMIEHPFYRRLNVPKNITAANLSHYYNTLAAKVDDLPDHIRNEVVSHTSYLNLLKEKEILPDLTKKIAEFISAMELITKQERPDIMLAIYKQLDGWIYEAFVNNERLNEVHKRNQKIDEELISSICKDVRDEEDEKLLKQLVDEEDEKRLYLKEEELDRFVYYLFKERIVNNKEGFDSFKQLEEALTTDFNSAQELDEGSKRLWLRTIYSNSMDSTDRLSNLCLEETDKIIDKIKCYEYKKQTNVEKVKRFQEQQKKLTLEEYEQQFVDAKEKRIQELNEMIERCQEELSNLKETNDFLKEGAKFEEEMLERYIQFDKQVKDHSKQYNEATQSFVGQLISPAFNINK